MKGCSKPAGFKLGRAQMIPDGNLVFDYVTDVSKAGKGSFFNRCLVGSTDQADSSGF